MTTLEQCGLRFALEASERLRIFCQIVRKKFPHHQAVQTQIFRLVDNA